MAMRRSCKRAQDTPYPEPAFIKIASNTPYNNGARHRNNENPQLYPNSQFAYESLLLFSDASHLPGDQICPDCLRN